MKCNFRFADVWVAAGRAPLASRDFDELYAQYKPNPTFFSGAVAVMLPTADQVTSLFRTLERRSPNLCVIVLIRLDSPRVLTLGYCLQLDSRWVESGQESCTLTLTTGSSSCTITSA